MSYELQLAQAAVPCEASLWDGGGDAAWSLACQGLRLETIKHMLPDHVIASLREAIPLNDTQIASLPKGRGSGSQRHEAS